jgi:hypothetical protein
MMIATQQQIGQLQQQNGWLMSLLSNLPENRRVEVLSVEVLPPITPISSAAPLEPSTENASILVVPEKPKRKGGRNIRALPYVVSGNDYIEMEGEAKRNKQNEEDNKQKRRDETAERKKQRLERTAAIQQIKQEKEE